MKNSKIKKLQTLLSYLSKLIDYAFWSFILLFLFVVILYRNNLVDVLGYEFSIVQTKSMQGTIDKFDFLVISKISPQNIHQDDIIVFFDDTGQYKVIHRVIEIKTVDGQLLFKTKGDHNPAADIGYRTENQIYAKYAFRVPYFGYLIMFLTTKYGILAICINVWNLLLISILWKFEGQGTIVFDSEFKRKKLKQLRKNKTSIFFE